MCVLVLFVCFMCVFVLFVLFVCLYVCVSVFYVSVLFVCLYMCVSVYLCCLCVYTCVLVCLYMCVCVFRRVCLCCRQLQLCVCGPVILAGQYSVQAGPRRGRAHHGRPRMVRHSFLCSVRIWHAVLGHGSR